jgi:ribonucleoside-diphosphate reductase subunit M2
MSDSPTKKLDFAAMDKENIPATVEPAVIEIEPKKPLTEVIKTEPETPKAAPSIKQTEADEPLLQENPQRFVLFPIKYHEVSARHDASRVK